MKKNTKPTLGQYSRLLLEQKETGMPYDDPTKFGEALAQRHADMLDEALSKWSKTAIKPAKSKAKVKQTVAPSHSG